MVVPPGLEFLVIPANNLIVTYFPLIFTMSIKIKVLLLQEPQRSKVRRGLLVKNPARPLL